MNIKLFSGMLGTRPTPSTSSSSISNLAIGMGTEQEIGIYDVLRQITENWITWIQEVRLNMWFAGWQKIWFIELQFVFEEVLFPVFMKPISETIIWYQILMRPAAPLGLYKLLETEASSSSRPVITSHKYCLCLTSIIWLLEIEQFPTTS